MTKSLKTAVGRGCSPAMAAEGPACILFALALLLSAGVVPAAAQKSRPDAGTAAGAQIPILKEIGIDQKLDAKMPLDAEFSDEQGAPVKLGQFFGPRPVVLALVYYGCPMLCTQVLNGLAGSLQGVTFTAGQEYEVVVVSFDPGETPAMAAERKKNFVEPVHPRGRREPHPLPDGTRVVHQGADRGGGLPVRVRPGDRPVCAPGVHHGADPGRPDVALPLRRRVCAARPQARDCGSVGRPGRHGVDQALLFCYHYDPETGRYRVAIMNFMRAAGALTVLALGAWIGMSLRRERRQARPLAPTSTGTR